MIRRLVDRVRALELATRVEHPDLTAALQDRWAKLPAHVKTPTQMLGRRTTGCEGTHGVFPRCNLACTPCYHAKEAQRVRTDGEHTARNVDAQMAYLRSKRGPGQNAQLIGGEVTLLGPEAHGDALEAMTRHGRKPMSMTHGDFDYDYLKALAVRPDGTNRFDFLSFAGHFDSMMLGRRGIKSAKRERELHPYRKAFCEHFQRLQREHGVKHYLAHNITVTPRNIGQIAEVIEECKGYGFRMFSFQPAAFVGNTKRWKDDYREFTGDDVWAEVEKGVGARLHWRAFQLGDERCNRTAYGAFVGSRYVPLLDEDSPKDRQWLQDFVAAFGGADLAVPAPVAAVKVARALARHPRALPGALGWAARFVRRAGVVGIARHGVQPITFVMHSFMDAKLVRPAWQLLEEGVMSDDPEILATQERLQACMYAMAHPDDDRLVPACAQHSVLDPLENLKLLDELPMVAVPGTAPVSAPS